MYTSLILAQSSLFPDPPSGPSITHFFCRTFPATMMNYNCEPTETFIKPFQVFCHGDKMKDLCIHLRVRILLWACSRSCGFGCLGRAEGSLQFRGNVLTGSFPICSTEPRVFYAGGDRQASAVWGHFIPGYQMGSIFGPAHHSVLHGGAQSSSCAQIPAVTVVYFQPGLVCTQNPGEKGKLLELGTWKWGWRAV